MASTDALDQENWPFLFVLTWYLVSHCTGMMGSNEVSLTLVSVCGASIVKIYYVFAVDNSSDSTCKMHRP